MPITSTWTTPSTLNLDIDQILAESFWDNLVSNTLYLYDTLFSAKAVDLTLAGNVRIGGTSIASKVHVEGTANAKASQVSLTGTSTASVALRPTSLGLAFLTDTAGFTWRTGVTVGTDGDTGSERVRLDSSGNAGLAVSLRVGSTSAAEQAGTIRTQIDGSSSGVSVPLMLKNTTGATNEKVWDLFFDSATSLSFRVVQDSYGGADTWLKVTRSAAVTSAVQFPAGVVAIGGTTASTGSLRSAFGWTWYARNTDNSANHEMMRQINVTGVTSSIQIGDWLSAGHVAHIELLAGATGVTINLAAAAVGRGVQFQGTNARVIPSTDNDLDLGSTTGANFRWKAVYAVNGTIQTSSEDAKEHIADLDPEVALAIILGTSIKTFNYRNSPWLQAGFLAEKTDRLLTLDGKSASPQSTASLAFAGVQALHARIAFLEKRFNALTGAK